MCGGEEMTAAFLYWWECLWIFEGPLNLPWDEIRKRQPLCVAFIFPQHNISLFLKALYNSCVNPLPWQNVSIIQRPFSHTHYSGVIHISFFLSSADDVWACVCILNSVPLKSVRRNKKKIKKRWPEIEKGAQAVGIAARWGWFTLPPAHWLLWSPSSSSHAR